MLRLLVTGFEPADGAARDAAWEAVDLLRSTWDGDAELVTRQLPWAFGRASRRLLEHVAAHTPDVVVAVATAPGSDRFAVERLAVNWRDAQAPDAAGRQPVRTRIREDAPAAEWSTLPVTAMVDALTRAGIPADDSVAPGTGVANDTFYLLQRALVGLDVTSGLIRVPATPEMALGPGVPTLLVQDLAHGLGVAISALLRAHRTAHAH